MMPEDIEEMMKKKYNIVYRVIPKKEEIKIKHVRF